MFHYWCLRIRTWIRVMTESQNVACLRFRSDTKCKESQKRFHYFNQLAWHFHNDVPSFSNIWCIYILDK